MESEEMKEIKTLIRYLADTYGTSKCIGNPNRELFTDILTLINELESKNERLIKLQARGGCRVAELGIENQQLKDRIAELEKEIESLKGNIVYREKCEKELVNACDECNSKIEKFGKKFELNIGKHLKKKYDDHQQDSFYYIVNKADVDMCLDETLKECLCEKHQ